MLQKDPQDWTKVITKPTFKKDDKH